MRIPIAAPDGDRGDSAEPPFRRIDLVARDLKSKTAAGWLALPVPVLLAVLLVLVGIVHALVGVRSVVLDYVGARGRLLEAKFLFRVVAVIVVGAGVLAILKLSFGR